MKQTTTRKLFRKCPYQQEHFACAQCPNHKRCIEKKRVRRLEHIINNVWPIIIMTMAIAAATIVIVTLLFSSDEKREMPTAPETITEKFVDGGEETSPEAEPTRVTAPEVEPTTGAEPEVEPEVEPNSIYDLSDEEKFVLAKLVWAEARGEPFEGKVAVAAVVLNRYYYGEAKDFDKESIEAVVKQPGQFASIQNVTMDDLQDVPECMQAVEAACEGEDPTREVFPEGALYFFAHDKVSGYQKEIRQGLKVMIIANHTFHYNFEKVG